MNDFLILDYQYGARNQMGTYEAAGYLQSTFSTTETTENPAPQERAVFCQRLIQRVVFKQEIHL